MTLSWWSARMSPSVVALGVLCFVILHTGFGVPRSRAYVPAIILTAIYALLCIGMFWARKQFDESRDLRLGAGLFGLYCLITGQVGMWYAGVLGIVSSAIFAENWIPFSVYMSICTAISLFLVSRWKSYPKPK